MLGEPLFYFQEKLKVSVYYESLCPDSINFLVKQFYPVYSTGLKEHLDVDLVPYGKAAVSINNSSI